MVIRIILLFLTITSVVEAGEKTIVCGFGQCSADFVPVLQLDQSEQTYIEISQNNPDNVTVTLPNEATPRDLVLVMENNSTIGKDLTVDFASKKREEAAPSFMLLGDIVNNLNINLNGYDGASGEDASVICANRFKNGDYGAVSQNFFNSRRQNNPALDPNKCDATDVSHIQETKFSCQNAGFSLSEFDTVEVERIKFKQRCIGTTIRSRCLQKTMSMTCEWAARSPGFHVGASKHSAGSPCPNQWASSSNCSYSYNYSCWHSRTTAQTPPSGVNPQWEVVKELGRCGYPVYGGKFALQYTDTLPERVYTNAVNENRTANLCASFPSPPAPYWFYNKIRSVTISEPGLDPETLEPLPGSTWDVKLSNFFEPCDSLYDTLNSVIDSWTAFGDVGNSCSDARLTEDPNNVIPWNKAGLEQRAEFGTEKILCSPNECNVSTIARDIDVNFDSIDPTSGANGTSQGSGTLLVYDINDLTSSAVPGNAGIGGKSDLPLLEETKYCVKVDDVASKGIQSTFAKDPVVNFNIYKWQGLNINRGEPGGGNPELSGKKVNVYKKIDASVRYLIKQELF